MSRPYVKKTKQFFLVDIDADSDALNSPLWYLETDIKIDKVRFGVDTAVTAADTNYQKVAVTDGSDDIASITTGPAASGDDLTAGAFLAKDPAAAHAEKSAGDTLKVEYTKTGTGMALSGLIVEIDYYEYGA